METFSAILAIFSGNSPVTGDFPAQRPVTHSFDFFICTWINGWVNNRDTGDLRRHRAHYDGIVMWLSFIQYATLIMCTVYILLCYVVVGFRCDGIRRDCTCTVQYHIPTMMVEGNIWQAVTNSWLCTWKNKNKTKKQTELLNVVIAAVHKIHQPNIGN